MSAPSTIRIGRIEHAVTVLGPGTRTVVWVAGCGLACPECITPELWPADSGEDVPIGDLARELVAAAVDGVTWSGGEPFDQARAVAAVNSLVRAARPALSLVAYSGHTRNALERRRDPGCVALLGQLDLLVDGRYMRRRHARLRWRGSSNQRIHALTNRHADELDAPDVPAGLHRHVDADGGFRFTGVPPIRQFRTLLEAQLAAGMADVREEEEA